MAPAHKAVYAQDVNLGSPYHSDKCGPWCQTISWLPTISQAKG